MQRAVGELLYHAGAHGRESNPRGGPADGAAGDPGAVFARAERRAWLRSMSEMQKTSATEELLATVRAGQPQSELAGPDGEPDEELH